MTVGLRYRIACLLLVGAAWVFASDEGTFRVPHTGGEAVSLPSVEAAALCRHLEHSVNHASGTASFSMPLHTLVCGDMSLPVSLYYRTQAVKVDDEDGPAGVGWELQCGGIVSRSIAGRPDEISGTVIPTGGPTLEYLVGLNHYKIDGDYDIYQYCAGKYSGSFIIVGGVVVKLQDSDVKIKRTDSGVFRITVPDGTEYVYDITETVSYDFSPIVIDMTTHSPDYDNAVCAWRLSRIVNPARTDSIVVEYVDMPSRVRFPSARLKRLSANNISTDFVHESGGLDGRDDNQRRYTYANRHGLSKIGCRAGSINFIDPASEPVKGFTVNAPDGKEIKRVTFDYITYRSIVKSNVSLLTGVNVTAGGITVDGAEFEYNDPRLYMGNRDIFGYNNYRYGQVYSSASVLTAKIPEDTTDILLPVLPDDGLIVAPLPGVDTSTSSTERARIVISEERMPYFDALKSKTLKSVTTHSGAKTELEYEPNEVDRHFIFDGTEYALAPGLRIKRERVTDPNTRNVREKEYTYTGGKSTIDFSKIGYSAFIGLSGNRSVVMPHLSLCYTTGAVLLASSRMPGAAMEDAGVYYAEVRETVTGTGLDAPIITDYCFDLTDVETPFVMAGQVGLSESKRRDERFCGTMFTPQTHPLFIQAYGMMLSPQIVGGYFKSKYIEKAPLLSKTEWVTDASGSVVRKFRTTEYCYSKEWMAERTIGYYCDPLVRTVTNSGIGLITEDYKYIDDFNYFPVRVSIGRHWCDSVKVTEYDAAGNSRAVVQSFEYNDKIQVVPRSAGLATDIVYRFGDCHLLSKVSTSCGGDTYSTEYLYSANSVDRMLYAEALRGRISLPVSEKFRHGGFMMEKRYGYTDFGVGKGNVQLSSVVCAVDGTVLTDSISMTGYDIYGNPLEAVDFSGLKRKYVWGGNGTYLRQSSVGGYLTTQYEYSPLVGYTKITTPAGMVTDYAYTAGRLASQSVAGDEVAAYSYSQYGDDSVNKVVASHTGANGGTIAETSRYDAFGNLLLSGVSGGGSGESVVSLSEYDILGRKLKSYFPIGGDDVNGNIGLLTQSVSSTYSDDSQPFVKTVYNLGADTRERIITLGGSEFASHPIWFDYRFNTADGDLYSCRRYRVNGSTLHHDGNYTAGSLEIRETTDGDGRKTMQFTDFSGKAVLTRAVGESGNADTYSVYDDAGNLVLVLPPLASEALSTAGASYDISTNETLRDYADYYRYDGRGLLVERRMAGTEPVYYYHDNAGRVIFTQDGEQRLRGVMGFAVNDLYGRPALEGETLATPELMSQVRNMRPYALRSQTLSGRHAGYGVSMSLFRTVIDKAYYYDDYSFLSEDCFTKLNERLVSRPLNVKRSGNRGLLTGLLTRVTTASDYEGSKTPMTDNSSYSTTAYGYDKREQVAESVTAGHDSVTIVASTSYSTSGLPLTVTTSRTDKEGNVSTVAQQYGYDGLDRQVSVTTAVDGVEMARTATAYDDKGRVASVSLSDLRSGNKNMLSYGYLTNGRIKNMTTSNSGLEISLGYASGMYPSYSGNISSQSWKGSEGVNRLYNYRYDKLNRLTLADYYEANRSSITCVSYPGIPDYDASYSYDLNGNIRSIYRKGMTDMLTISGRKYVTFGDVDRLTLSYRGNRLKSVTDAAPKIYYTGANDFDDGADEDSEYEYDANGNMTVDLNRGIVGTVYNRQNLPVRIEFADGAEIENMYDADGMLLQRKLSGSTNADGTDVRVTDYSGVWEYENGGLDRIHIPGGYIKDGTVCYHITDHQGNVRQVWDATSDAVVQENHYYPYGSLFGESASVEHQIAMSQTADNPYRYGGKEWLTHGGLNHYDFAARMYDPSLGRFNRPDPLNGSYPHLSPYLYCAGNPINATDPTGMAVIFSPDGVCLGTSSEGFTGDILIFKGGTITTDDGTTLDFSDGNGYSFSNFSETFLREHLLAYNEVNLSIKAHESIWNRILSEYEGTQVYDETFSMSRIAGNGVKYLNYGYNDTNWGTEYRDKEWNIFERPRLYGTGLFHDDYEATVHNIASSLIVHEWYSHGMKHNDDIYRSHRLAYKNVINFKLLWNDTTDKYKRFVLGKLMKYITDETGRTTMDKLYMNLYNKYGK